MSKAVESDFYPQKLSFTFRFNGINIKFKLTFGIISCSHNWIKITQSIHHFSTLLRWGMEGFHCERQRQNFMRVFIICTVYQILLGSNQGDEMGGICSMYRDEKGRKNLLQNKKE
jgi:hypothetical protein